MNFAMQTTLLICDDSNLARKQLARSLPANLDMEIHFATNGIEGVEAKLKCQPYTASSFSTVM